MTPVTADTVAVTGEQRYTASPAVPLRPGKLRLNARKLFVPVAGTCPMPAHEPHVGSETLAPAASRSASTPSRAMTSRMRWLPGNTTNDTDGATCLPRSAWLTAHMSSHELFVHDPTTTCSIGVPATSATGTTASGEPGIATSGSIVPRSSSICSSYSASASAASGCHSLSRPSSLKYSRVASSDGNTLVVSVSSAPMLQIVARWGSDSDAAPGPAYSKILPLPPRTE